MIIQRICQPQKITGVLAKIVGFLMAAHIFGMILKYGFGHGHFHGLVPLFDLDVEYNIPSAFSAILFLFCGLILSYQALVVSNWREKDFYHWLGLALLFAFLAWDEFTSVHEVLAGPVSSALNIPQFYHFAWLIPYGGFLLFLAVMLSGFLKRLPDHIRSIFLHSALIFLFGAVVLESLSGLHRTLFGINPDLLYALIVCCEEFLEMGGILMFNYGLLTYLEINLAAEAKKKPITVKPNPAVLNQSEPTSPAITVSSKGKFTRLMEDQI